jgi:cardiolipin synthase A/B
MGKGFWLSFLRTGLVVLVTVVAFLALLNILPGELGPDQVRGPPGAVDSLQFQGQMAALLGSPVIDGNSVSDLQNGQQIFPAMLRDIAAAKTSIDLEMYIFRSGEIGQRFVEALSARARAGVPVHVLADWIGSRDDADIGRQLRAAGAQFHFFRAPHWRSLDRLNNRTHRKLLIVDGRVAYTGGAGIDDAWMGDAETIRQERDMMFRLRGPIVSQFQGTFEHNWTIESGQVLLGDAYFPPLQAQDNTPIQSFASAPEGGSQTIGLMYLLAIRAARSTIDIEASYFLPDARTRKALDAALARGVRVRIVLAGAQVAPFVGHASREHWGSLLAAGATIARFRGATLHSKLLILDGFLTMGGSSNFDSRSFYFNDEADINVFGRAFAAHMTTVFDADLARSRRVTLAQWQARSRTTRLLDWFWSLASLEL